MTGTTILPNDQLLIYCETIFIMLEKKPWDYELRHILLLSTLCPHSFVETFLCWPLLYIYYFPILLYCPCLYVCYFSLPLCMLPIPVCLQLRHISLLLMSVCLLLYHASTLPISLCFLRSWTSYIAHLCVLSTSTYFYIAISIFNTSP